MVDGDNCGYDVGCVSCGYVGVDGDDDAGVIVVVVVVVVVELVVRNGSSCTGIQSVLLIIIAMCSS